MPRITDADAHMSSRRADVDAASRHRTNPLSQRITGDDVSRLAEALRAAKHAHSASLAELRQADADPVEDWAVWYAEYLLGVR